MTIADPATVIDLNAAAFAVAAHDRHQWPADTGAEVAFAGRSNVGKSSAINAITRRRQLARVSKTPGRTRQIVFFDLVGERAGDHAADRADDGDLAADRVGDHAANGAGAADPAADRVGVGGHAGDHRHLAGDHAADGVGDRADAATPRRLVDLPGYGYARAPLHLRRHWQSVLADYLSQRASLRALVIPMDIRRPLTDLDRTMLRCCFENHLPAHILLTKADKLTRARAAAALAAAREQLRDRPQTTAQLFSAHTKQGVAEATAAVVGWLG